MKKQPIALKQDITELDVLIRAREILSSPEKLARKVFARNAKGDAVNYEDAAAVSFSLYGAMARAEIDLNPGAIDRCVAYRATKKFAAITKQSVTEFELDPNVDYELTINTLDDVIDAMKRNDG